MNEEISDAISESVRDLLHRFLSMRLVSDPQPVQTPPDKPDEAQICAVVCFTGALRGALLVQGSAHTACLLAASLAGKSFSCLDDDALEVVGEFADLIAGGVRSRLSSHGEIRMAPPLVVMGQEYTLHNARIFCSAQQFFQIQGGRFRVECLYLKDCA
ncbi:MAG: chemotaxis protein CheX [Magnetococcales bacterium]|nr:chemotaxis protein CheX [Magnetococcales bacterium]